MRLALYQPDIPQNTGTLLRLSACVGVPIDIIGPAGFDLSDRALRRAGMDYLDHVDLTRHLGWASFYEATSAANRRVILLSTHASIPYTSFQFLENDCLMLGRESAGVPDDVHRAADAAICIPMQPGVRSLNIAVAGSMVLGEALRQTRWTEKS